MSHPDQLRFRKGGGVLMLFGLPFFLMSLLFMTLGLRGEMTADNGQPAHPLFVILFCLPFFAVGAGFIFGRAGVDIDRRAGSVVAWWGLLFIPLRSKRHDLAGFTHVTLRRKVVKSKNSTRIVYPFALAREGGDVIECEAPGDYTRALAGAESLAKFTSLDLHDSAQGPLTVREAAFLDETVVQRARRLGLDPHWPEMPAGCRIRYDSDGESGVFRLPPPGFPWLYLIMAVPALIFVSFVVFTFILPFSRESPATGDASAFRVVFLGFLSLFVLIPILAVAVPLLRAIVREITVAASRDGIHVRTRGPLSSRRWTFPADELEEITVNRPGLREAAGPVAYSGGNTLPEEEQIPENVKKIVLALATHRAGSHGPGLRLRSDREFCTLGSHLADSEIVWLRDALTFILVHAPGA